MAKVEAALEKATKKMLPAHAALAHLTDDRAVVIISPPMPAKDLPGTLDNPRDLP